MAFGWRAEIPWFGTKSEINLPGLASKTNEEIESM